MFFVSWKGWLGDESCDGAAGAILSPMEKKYVSLFHYGSCHLRLLISCIYCNVYHSSNTGNVLSLLVIYSIVHSSLTDVYLVRLVIIMAELIWNRQILTQNL